MTVRMVSTRDAAKTAYSYTDALLKGLAEDGGLFVPEEFPRFTNEELPALKNAPYADIAYAVKKRLIAGAIPDSVLRRLIDDAYAANVFAAEHGEIAPVKQIDAGLFVQNLSLGPTASFKDMAMQLLSRETAYELARRKEELAILGATSGDTGSAAEAAFKDRAGIKLFMLSPEKGMSDFQLAQMGALSGGNICNISVRGRFDDCQDLVKTLKSDAQFASLGAVNSINWARISSQIPYYFSGYLRIAREVGEPIDFAVPSGNFGNVLSGYYAKVMGLPIRRLIVATNENNVLHKLITTGNYEAAPARVTSSPSMDISKASNYERLVFDVFDADASKTTRYMREFAESGRVSLADYGLTTDAFTERGFVSGTSSHADRLRTMRYVYERSGTIIDPHTADGVHAARELADENAPIVCLATALPVKFEHTIQEALSFIPPRPQRFASLEMKIKDDAFLTIDADVDELKKILRARLSKN